MADSETLPEFVRDSKLNTIFLTDRNGQLITSHIKSWRHIRENWIQRGDIGAGSYGIVRLEARLGGGNSDSRTLRAVKEIRKHRSSSGTVRYVRELEALAKFSQDKYIDSFVKFYGWYETPSSLFIATEYCSHGDLGQYLHDNGRLPEEETREIAIQVLGALDFMHEERFAHRDLKPANILIKTRPPDDWLVKVSDMGLAKRTADILGSLTIKGTPDFMAPELFDAWKDPKTIDPFLADMWSFGETIFRTLTNQKAFESRPSLHQYLTGHLEFPRSILHQVHASEDLIDFTQSLMKPEPKERYSASQAIEHRWVKSGLKQPPSPTELSLLPEGPLPVLRYSQSHEITPPSGSWSTTGDQRILVQRPRAQLSDSVESNGALDKESSNEKDGWPDSDETRDLFHEKGTPAKHVLQRNRFESQDQVTLVPRNPNEKRKTAVVVVSADRKHSNYRTKVDYLFGLLIVLSLNTRTDLSKLRVFVLIYAPQLQGAIDLPVTFERLKRLPDDPLSELSQIYGTALSLLEDDKLVMPFTKPTSYVHMMQYLQPDFIYIEKPLADSSAIASLHRWFENEIVVVRGDTLYPTKSERKVSMINGVGRAVLTIHGRYFGEDWESRVK